MSYGKIITFQSNISAAFRIVPSSLQPPSSTSSWSRKGGPGHSMHSTGSLSRYSQVQWIPQRYVTLGQDLSLHSFKDFIYLFFERGEGRERKREGNISVREKHQSVASCTRPNLGPNLQPRLVPWIKPATFHFAEQRTTIWATPVRAVPPSLK